jgi:membrane associated rhomboid family serine protease
MVLPIGDAPNPRGVPVLTYLLIAANVAVYVLVTLPLGALRPSPDDPLLAEYVQAMSRALEGRASLRQLLQHVSQYDLFVFAHGFRPVEPSLASAFTSMFLHGGFLHLFGNMLFLWIYGDNVEHRLGRLGYLVGYLGTGFAATAMQSLAVPDSSVPMIGASGAISGVLGFYFLWFPRNRVRLLWLLPPFVMDVFEIPARIVLGLYLILDNLLPFLVVRSATGVAHGAHIGGFVAGVAAAWLLARREVVARPAEYGRRPSNGAAGRDGIGAAIEAGRYADAAEAYFAMPAAATRGVLTPPAALALAGWLRAEGHPDAALVVLRRLLRDVPRGGGVAEAHVLAGAILLEDLGEPTPAYQHFVDALDLDPPPRAAEAARRGLAVIEGMQKRRIGRVHARGGA